MPIPVHRELFEEAEYLYAFIVVSAIILQHYVKLLLQICEHLGPRPENLDNVMICSPEQVC